jgi:hypothetical protein
MVRSFMDAFFATYFVSPIAFRGDRATAPVRTTIAGSMSTVLGHLRADAQPVKATSECLTMDSYRVYHSWAVEGRRSRRLLQRLK